MLAWRRTAVHQRVLVNLKTEKALAGVLVAQRGPLLILEDGSLLQAGVPPTELDGRVLVERSNVDFVQVVKPREV